MMDRKRGIGGTDISAIVGLNPWKTPLDVFLEKTGQGPPDEDSEVKWWGREMEPVLAKRYEKETGKKLVRFRPEDAPIVHPKFSWMVGRPDAVLSDGATLLQLPSPDFMTLHAEAGVDFKTSGQPQEWGKPGTDEVPEQYLIQAEFYMGLTGAQYWDIACLLMSFTRKFAIYRVNRDTELIENLIEAGEKFWTDHVLTGTPPALDGSKSATEYLKKKYPFDSGPILEPTDPEILALIEAYRDDKADLKRIEADVASKENYLKNFIGDAAGMQGPWGKITWRRSKDSTVFDAKRFQATCPDMAKDFLITKPGSRRWLPKFTKED